MLSPTRCFATKVQRVTASSLFHRGNFVANSEGVHRESQTAPRIAALLVALALAGSAGASSAATTASSDSWFGGVELWAECVLGTPAACMAASGGPGYVTPTIPIRP